MNSIFKNFCLIAIVLLKVPICAAVGVASDFRATTDLMFQHLVHKPVTGIPLTEIKEMIAKTQIDSKPELILDGVVVDAINYPDPVQPKIDVSEAGWSQIERDQLRKMRLVLHEFLGLMGIEDSNYKLSNQLEAISFCTRSLAIRNFIERYVHQIPCERMAPEDLLEIGGITVGNPEESDGLKPGDFFYFTNTKFLRMSTKQTVLKQRTFEGATSLQAMSLYSDTLKEIQDFTFKGLIRLQKMELHGQIENLGDQAFNGLESLTELTLRYISDRMPTESFRQLSGLKTLTLEGFRVSAIRQGSFSPLFSLEKLVFSYGSVAELYSGAFDGLNQLKVLQLSNPYFYTSTCLGTWKPGAFRDLVKLEKLEACADLQFIGKLTSPHFDGLQSLRELILHLRGPVSFESGMVGEFPNLQKIKIGADIEQLRELKKQLSTELPHFNCYVDHDVTLKCDRRTSAEKENVL